MAMLGDILAAASRSTGGVERWLLADHPRLHEAVGKAAASEGTSVSGFARVAVADFSERASEEDWASLTSRLRDSQDPGVACLLTMLEWRIAADPGPNHPLGGT